MSKKIDLTGHVYGRFTVISESRDWKTTGKWFCVCSCGNKRSVRGSELRTGKSKSCGCIGRETIDLTGHVYGRLSVTSVSENGGVAGKWLCNCSCGKSVWINGNSLRTGSTKSCGCLRDEKTSLRSTKHKSSKKPEYSSWKGMFYRCYNDTMKGFHRYGGRGITVCEEWSKDFNVFYKDMGDKPSPIHSIDRINNDLGYSPANCKWSTPKEQAQNRCTTKRF